MLALTYYSNNSVHRSELADRTLVRLQPYLISLGWYTELAPIALVTGEEFDHAMAIEYKTRRSDTRWKTWIDSKRSDARWRRLVSVAGALAQHEDTDGLGLIAHSLVTHAARDGISIERIRFAMTAPEVSKEPEAIYEASVIALDENDVTLIPDIEPTRSVPAVPSMQKAGS